MKEKQNAENGKETKVEKYINNCEICDSHSGAAEDTTSCRLVHKFRFGGVFCVQLYKVKQSYYRPRQDLRFPGG